jgi:lipoprotein-anchoring transpeptidase ErfK/SrfK
MYYQLNNTKQAERFYQKALQQGALLQRHLLASAPADSALVVQQTISSATALPAIPPILTRETATSAVIENSQPEYVSDRLTGTKGTYTVIKGETISLIAAKLGISRSQLAAMNGLNPKAVLQIGQQLRYNNRRIIPEHRIQEGIVINIPDRMLYLFQQGRMAFSTAVALGTPVKTDQFVWQTPTGKFRIVNKAKNPTWTVPPSIQEEMRLEGKEVISSIPPGPDNPLGKYAIKTSLPGILIHSTTKPWSIYTYASHGCIRVYPERMEELFKLVQTHSFGEIIYRPVKLAVTDDGRVLLEVHGDIYKKTRGLAIEAQALIRARKLDEKVDWTKVNRVIARKAGVAEEITRTSLEVQKTLGAPPLQSPS